MRKIVAFLLCVVVVFSLVSCNPLPSSSNVNADENGGQAGGEVNHPSAGGPDLEEGGKKDDTVPLSPENENALKMYEAAIKGEMNVIDANLGELKLSDCVFPTDNLRLIDCEMLLKATADMDQDGIVEYVIRSPQGDHIIMHYSDGEVYSYSFDYKSFFKLNTDGTFYSRYPNPDSVDNLLEMGLNRISFHESSVVIKEVYKMKTVYNYEMAKEYYLDGHQVTRREYRDYYNRNHKVWAQFTPLEFSCQYPITAEKAWNIADDYLENIDGHYDCAAGSKYFHKVVITEKPTDGSEYYIVTLQSHRFHHIFEAWEVSIPSISERKFLTVNAVTGECVEFVPDGKKDDTVPPSSEDENAMKLFKAAIDGEILVVDEDLGEIALKNCCFASNGTRLEECVLLTKTIVDVDRDGVNEYVIKSPDGDCLVMRCYNDGVYTYSFDADDICDWNTDGTIYWNNHASEGERWEGGISQIVFDGETYTLKSICSLRYLDKEDINYYESSDFEFYVNGESVTFSEFYQAEGYRINARFTPFAFSSSYPISAEQAWDLANAFWENADGATEGAAGTHVVYRVVLIDTPNADTSNYRIELRAHFYSNQRVNKFYNPPKNIKIYGEVLVNALTGEAVEVTE